jgi:beta-lactamase superfamily II metal-dependent hydrolase
MFGQAKLMATPRRTCAIAVILLAVFCVCAAEILTAQTDTQIGTPLPPWSPGMLDIHQISTGRGNAAFFIFPDGTTLLVDAGAAADGLPQTDPHPDASRQAGGWIARYIKRHMPAGTRQLDYALITHFHPDHMGQVTPASKLDRTGTYKLTGITEVDNELPIRALIDRGWPDYNYPLPLTDEMVMNYRHFIDQRRAGGMTVARFNPGSSSQILLQKDATRYPDFQVRNIIGNGEVWIGTADATRRLFPPLESLAQADWPTENMCSLGFRLQYGRFRYFTGGDLPGNQDPGFPQWHAIEPAIAGIVGPVDVQVINQHGSMGEASDAWLQSVRSTVFVIPAWGPSHPAPDVLKRLVNSRFPPLSRYIFTTDMREAAKIVIGARATQLAGPPGHIVVRVENGGDRYRVFALNNDDESDIVSAASGPFSSASVP